MKWNSADSPKKSATPQPMRESSSTTGVDAGVPGGPSTYDAVTGRVKLLDRARIANI
ncbi:unannotated protein [freshwater metagenome]|uniref:Unannotated protein n=1 Tax=freshwater metagenome TaxID=449393 RepID=A0A6J7R4S7_9ZZZZ